MPLITFEGVEGMGKSTQLLGLEAALRQGGFSVLRTFEPGDTPLGRELRGHLLGHQFNPDKRTELLLYAADRAEHVAKVIRPMLQIQGAAGPAFVLCDRYADATLAYQGGGRALPMDWLRQLNHYATDGLQPDLTFLFDGDPVVGIERARGRALLDRIEKEEVSFFIAVRGKYLELAREEPHRLIIVDAMQPIESVTAAVRTAMVARFPQLHKALA